MRTRWLATARALAFWSLPVLAFMVTRHVRASHAELVLRYEIETTPGQLIGTVTHLQGEPSKMLWDGTLGTVTQVASINAVEFGDGGMAGNVRRVTLGPRQSATWHLDLGREAESTGTGHRGDLTFINLDRALPRPDRIPERVELVIRDQPGRGVWIPGQSPNGSGLATIECNQAWDLGIAVIGRVQRQEVLLEEECSLLANTTPPSSEDLAFLSRVNAACLEVFGASLGSPGLELFMRTGTDGDLLGHPFSVSRRGVPILVDRPSSRAVWVHLGQQLHAQHSRANFGPTLTDKSHLTWLDHGLARIVGEVFADHIEFRTTGAERAWDLELFSRYQASGPYDFSAESGPNSQRMSHQRIWTDAMSPLTLLEAARAAGFELANIRQPAQLRRFTEALASNTTPAEFAKLFEAGSELASANSRIYLSPQSEPQIEHVSQHESPDLVLMIEEDSMGFLETCGCRVNQAGGAARRASVLKNARAVFGEKLVLMDLGNRYPELKSWADLGLRSQQCQLLDQLFEQHAFDVVVPDPLDVMNLGWQDPPGWITQQGVSCNLTLSDGSGPSPYRILERAGRQIAIIGVSGDRWRMGHFNSTILIHGRNGYRIEPSLLRLQNVLAELSRLNSPPDVTIVAGQLPEVFVRAIVERRMAVDIIVSSDAATLQSLPNDGRQVQDEPLSTLSKGLAVVYSNEDSYALLSLGIRFDASGKVKAVDRVVHRLSDEVPEDPMTRSMIDEFYRTSSGPQAAALKPLFPNNGVDGGGYVGSAVCEACHKEPMVAWKQSKHGSAYHTLLAVQRNFVPKCVQCHVVGLGEQPSSKGATWGAIKEELLGVGCEVCHGGGANHIVAPSKSNIRRSMAVERCMVCHDEEHSGDFLTRYADALEQIRHW